MQQNVLCQKESASKGLPNSGSRSCIHCDRTMPEELFHFHKARGKYGNVCIECRREQGKKYSRPYTKEVAEAQYIKRLPDQLEASLRKTVGLLRAAERYGCPIEREAQQLLKTIYGETSPGQKAELEFQIHQSRRRA